MSSLLGLGVILLAVTVISAAPALDSLNGNQDGVSVSGISSGGAMAMQYHVAYSASTMGVGLVAGVPYHCAGGSMATALGACMNTPSMVSSARLTSYAQQVASNGQIDSLDSLKGDNAYIFAGTLDTTVNPGEGRVAEAIYRGWGANVKAVFDKAAVHTMPTDNYGAACDKAGSPYINNCNYNAAYDLLNHIYGGLSAPSPVSTQNLKQFDQAEFTSGKSKRFLTDILTTWTDIYQKNLNAVTDFWKTWLPGSGGSLPGLGGNSGAMMDSTGYVYIPTACQDSQTSCRVHVALHGCRQAKQKIGDVFVKNCGYNEVAEANNIVVLYPQVASDIIKNPNGCWDWWGYTDQNYALKDGVQMKAIKSMVDRLTA